MIAAARTEREAKALLADLQKLRVNESTSADLQTLAYKYKQYVDINSAAASTYQFGFKFDNDLLLPVHWGNPMFFAVGMAVEDGRLKVLDVVAETGVFSNTKRGAFATEDVAMSAAACDGRNICFGNSISSDGTPLDVMVHLSPRASSEERAYAFNLDCLSRFGGCQDARALILRDWK